MRNTRITVGDVLSWLASGMTFDEILSDFDQLQRDDILACLSYAAEREQHTTRILAAAQRIDVKLLLDENEQRKLVPPLQSVYPGSTQFELVGLAGTNDSTICNFAAESDFVIVSKNEDYERLITFRGFNPKLVRLTLGNTSNSAALNVLLSNAAGIIAALNNPRRGIVQLGQKQLAQVGHASGSAQCRRRRQIKALA